MMAGRGRLQGMDAVRPQLKKPSFPISEGLRAYLRRYRRERALPITYERLRRFSEAAKRQISEALALVDMEQYAERYPAQLSGGQQQRVALARTLVYRPEILLLDEPLSNLDAKLRDRARIWLGELQRRTGVTTVYVTHDQSEALAMSDKIRSEEHTS